MSQITTDDGHTLRATSLRACSSGTLTISGEPSLWITST